ncbi:MAG: PorT family protein, partial [Flavobacterium sp.]
GEAYYYTGDGLLPSYSVEQDYSIQYLSLGIMNKFDIVQGFHAVVGPTLDFKVGDNFPDFDDELLPLDITLMGGLGYTFPMGLTIEARYKIGLVDIFGNNYSTYDDDNYNDSDGNYNDVILNNVIQLGLAYSF